MMARLKIFIILMPAGRPGFSYATATDTII